MRYTWGEDIRGIRVYLVSHLNPSHSFQLLWLAPLQNIETLAIFRLEFEYRLEQFEQNTDNSYSLKWNNKIENRGSIIILSLISIMPNDGFLIISKREKLTFVSDLFISLQGVYNARVRLAKIEFVDSMCKIIFLFVHKPW